MFWKGVFQQGPFTCAQHVLVNLLGIVTPVELQRMPALEYQRLDGTCGNNPTNLSTQDDMVGGFRLVLVGGTRKP